MPTAIPLVSWLPFREKAMSLSDDSSGGIFREEKGSAPVVAPPFIPAPVGSSVQPAKPTADKPACTMINLPLDVAARLVAVGKAILADDLAPDGVEERSHITTLWGLLVGPDDVREAVANSGPVAYRFGDFAVFEGEEHDVLHVAVVSPDLHRLNALLGTLPCKPSDYDSYKPHCTIAYLKPGLGHTYAAAFNGVMGMAGGGVATEITYSGPDKVAVKMPLTATTPRTGEVREKGKHDVSGEQRGEDGKWAKGGESKPDGKKPSRWSAMPTDFHSDRGRVLLAKLTRRLKKAVREEDDVEIADMKRKAVKVFRRHYDEAADRAVSQMIEDFPAFDDARDGEEIRAAFDAEADTAAGLVDGLVTHAEWSRNDRANGGDGDSKSWSATFAEVEDFFTDPASQHRIWDATQAVRDRLGGSKEKGHPLGKYFKGFDPGIGSWVERVREKGKHDVSGESRADDGKWAKGGASGNPGSGGGDKKAARLDRLKAKAKTLATTLKGKTDAAQPAAKLLGMADTAKAIAKAAVAIQQGTRQEAEAAIDEADLASGRGSRRAAQLADLAKEWAVGETWDENADEVLGVYMSAYGMDGEYTYEKTIEGADEHIEAARKAVEAGERGKAVAELSKAVGRLSTIDGDNTLGGLSVVALFPDDGEYGAADKLLENSTLEKAADQEIVPSDGESAAAYHARLKAAGLKPPPLEDGEETAEQASDRWWDTDDWQEMRREVAAKWVVSYSDFLDGKLEEQDGEREKGFAPKTVPERFESDGGETLWSHDQDDHRHPIAGHVVEAAVRMFGGKPLRREKGFDESQHPRDDHGRFVEGHEIHAAKSDPKAAAALRARVTNPAERKKLDTAIAAPRPGGTASIHPDDLKKVPATPPAGTPKVPSVPTVDRHNPDLDEAFGAPAPPPVNGDDSKLRHNPDLDDVFGQSDSKPPQPVAPKPTVPPLTPAAPKSSSAPTPSEPQQHPPHVAVRAAMAAGKTVRVTVPSPNGGNSVSAKITRVDKKGNLHDASGRQWNLNSLKMRGAKLTAHPKPGTTPAGGTNTPTPASGTTPQSPVPQPGKPVPIPKSQADDATPGPDDTRSFHSIDTPEGRARALGGPKKPSPPADHMADPPGLKRFSPTLHHADNALKDAGVGRVHGKLPDGRFHVVGKDGSHHALTEKQVTEAFIRKKLPTLAQPVQTGTPTPKTVPARSQPTPGGNHQFHANLTRDLKNGLSADRGSPQTRLPQARRVADVAPPQLSPQAAAKARKAALPVAKLVRANPTAAAVLARSHGWANKMAEMHADRIAHRFGGNREKARAALYKVIRAVAHHAAQKGVGGKSKATIAGHTVRVTRRKGFDPSLFDDVNEPTRVREKSHDVRDEARDAHGQWTAGGAAVALAKASDQVGLDEKAIGKRAKSDDGDRTATSGGSSGGRVKAILAAADKIEVTDDKFGDGDAIGRRDYDDIERVLTDDEREQMTDYVNEQRDRYADDADIELSTREEKECAADAGWDDADIRDRAKHLIGELDDAKREHMGDAAEEEIDYWYKETIEVGVDAINELADRLDKDDDYKELAEKVRGLADGAESEIDDAIEDKKKEKVQELKDDYDGEDDQREWLKSFWDDNSDDPRLSGESDDDTGRWGIDGDGDHAYRFQTSGGDKYKMYMAKGDPPEIAFSDADGKSSVTGKGNAHEVFGGVVPAIVALLTKKDVPATTFTAKEPSRRRLYDRLVRTVASVAPQYAAVAAEVGGVKRYLLAHRDRLDGYVAKVAASAPGVTVETVVKGLGTKRLPGGFRLLKPATARQIAWWHTPESWADGGGTVRRKGFDPLLFDDAD